MVRGLRVCLLKWGVTRGSYQVSEKFFNHPCSQNVPRKCRSPAPEFLAKFKRSREAGPKARPWEGSGTSPDRTSTRSRACPDPTLTRRPNFAACVQCSKEGQRPRDSLLSRAGRVAHGKTCHLLLMQGLAHAYALCNIGPPLARPKGRNLVRIWSKRRPWASQQASATVPKFAKLLPF